MFSPQSINSLLRTTSLKSECPGNEATVRIDNAFRHFPLECPLTFGGFQRLDVRLERIDDIAYDLLDHPFRGPEYRVREYRFLLQELPGLFRQVGQDRRPNIFRFGRLAVSGLPLAVLDLFPGTDQIADYILQAAGCVA